MNPSQMKAPKDNLTVTLKRTFNISMPVHIAKNVDPITGPKGYARYWRVVGPRTHPNYHSDLSIAGLKDWGILKWY